MNNKLKDIGKTVVETGLTNIATLNTMFFTAMEQINSGIPIKNVIGTEAIQGVGLLTSGIYNYQAIRAQRNIDSFREELSKLKDNIIDNQKTINYIKNTLVPITLDGVVNESQSEKIKYIVNGIKTTVNDDSLQFDDITVIYYDILNELRVADIKMLFRIYNKKCKADSAEINGEFVTTDEDAFDRYILNKLKDKSLITMPVLNGELVGKGLGIVGIDSLNITKLGSNFIQFFKVNYEESME